MTRPFTQPRIRAASGEQLLLMAVLGNEQMRGKIDDELDRRARLGIRYPSRSSQDAAAHSAEPLARAA